MYQNQSSTPPASTQEPRHLDQKNPRRSKWSKAFAVVLTVAVLLLGVVGGTLAYLTAQSDPAENVFNPSHVTCEVKQSDDGYTVENTGDIAAYIRAKVVVTWAESGETEEDVTTVYPGAPQYSVSGTDWEKGNDGFYYYTKEVQVDNFTTSLTVVNSGVPEGYEARVEIMADAIQSVGVSSEGGTLTAVMDAWGVDPTTLPANP